ncbi:hypothetical protein EG832_08190 [bacterium]|nr:hypothetical protein [bacterium]
MRRVWGVLLLLGLITVPGSAFAVDVKVSGEFYAAGMYLDKTTFLKNSDADGPSTAFYFQRLRVRTDFIISPGLTLVTRFDAMERVWGGPRSAPGTVLDSLSQGTRAENENIAFDFSYVRYESPIGVLSVGYQPESNWGTVFGNSSTSVGKIRADSKVGPVWFSGYIAKPSEKSLTAINPTTASDRDRTTYMLSGTYAWKDGRAGLLYQYVDDRTTRSDLPTSYKAATHAFIPYAIAKIGPVALQAELTYVFGKATFDDLAGQDVDLSSIDAWLDATADFGMFYVGATFAYVAGDDPATANKMEGNLTAGGGADWNPCLIMWNYDRTYWAGALNGYGYGATSKTTFNGPMTNAWFYQVRGGVRPIAVLDIGLSVSHAYADKLPGANALTAVQKRTYGTEIDLTATYKITNNLSYMLGAGYFFTGDYFKGKFDNVEVNNDYLVMNKLTLIF